MSRNTAPRRRSFELMDVTNSNLFHRNLNPVETLLSDSPSEKENADIVSPLSPLQKQTGTPRRGMTPKGAFRRRSSKVFDEENQENLSLIRDVNARLTPSKRSFSVSSPQVRKPSCGKSPALCFKKSRSENESDSEDDELRAIYKAHSLKSDDGVVENEQNEQDSPFWRTYFRTIPYLEGTPTGRLNPAIPLSELTNVDVLKPIPRRLGKDGLFVYTEIFTTTSIEEALQNLDFISLSSESEELSPNISAA